MNLFGQKVKSPVFGIGTVIEHDGGYITADFAAKTAKFPFPGAFEKFLVAENAALQEQLMAMLDAEKQKKAAIKKAEDAARQATQARIQVATKTTSSRIKKSIDEMFSEDYHVAHLARQPILTYQQVEQQYGIKISGFGRGINPTPSSVVLISSIGKSAGKFVYHDKWTADGDYLYSGEGKTGDQTMTKGNLAIKNATQDGKKIHLFVKLSPQEYYYQGEFELVDYKYEDEQDECGVSRKEYKFRLRKRC